MTGKIFLSHSASDANAANTIRAALESAGHPCWIAPRDIPPGTDRKIPILPIRLDSTKPADAMEFYLGNTHWLDAHPAPIEPHLPTILAALGDTPKPPLALPDKPSLVVLPFQNLSGDPDQDYFADGMVDEITNALSRFRHLFVIARNTSFTYKGRTVDIKQVGRDLGVRYVLEGSIRRAANRLRINGQLIDAASGTTVWSDRFEGPLDDIFDLQDQVTARVVGAITPALDRAELQRARRKPTASLDAYDCYLHASAAFNTAATRADSEEGLGQARQGIVFDPDFAAAYALAAYMLALRKASAWTADAKAETEEGLRMARRAVQLGPDDALALALGGMALAYLGHDIDAGLAMVRRAAALNPNLSLALSSLGWMNIWDGRPDDAIEPLNRAIRLSPLDPAMPRMLMGIAHAHFFAGRYHEAMVTALAALRERPNHHDILRISAASCAMAGDLEKAREVIARLRAFDPSLRVSTLRAIQGPYRHSSDHERYEEAFRRAGLPE